MPDESALIEDKQNHNYFFAVCPECRKRGVKNRSEIRKYADGIASCESCARSRKGELTKDIPSLKLYVDPDLAPSHESHRQVNGVTPVIPRKPQPLSQPLIDSETLEYVDLLSRIMDKDLQDEILDCILVDRELVKSILSNPRLFSLKELKKHARRLNVIDPILEKPGQTFEDVLSKTSKPSKKTKRKAIKKWRSKKLQQKVSQSNKLPDTSKSQTSSPSKQESGETLPNVGGTTSPSSQHHRETEHAQANSSQANSAKDSKVNQEAKTVEHKI